MRWSLTVLLLICGVQSMGEEVTFVREVPKVGQTRTATEETSMELKMAVSVGGKVVQNVVQNEGEASVLRSTVLSLDGKKVSGVRVVCVQAVGRVTNQEGKLEDVPNPCQGKTYMVKVKGNERSVTYENGEEPPPAERDWVKEQFKSLGKDSSFESVLEGKTIKVGEKLDISPEKAAILMEVEEAGLKVEKFDLILKALRPQGAAKHAVFDAAITMSQAEGGMKMTFNMNGELVINAATCRPLAVQLAGPLKATGQQVQEGTEIDLDGAGRTSVKMSYEYGP